jgi:hypothetical protein
VIGVLAYLALVIVIPALLCGHVGEDFPPLNWWRALTGRAATAAPELLPARRPRPVPSWAHTEPYDYEEAA